LRFAETNGNGPPGDDADHGAERDITEEMPFDVHARRRDIGRDRVGRDARLPAEVALDDGCRRECHRGVA
jgi:hypothetical protein